MNFLYCIITDWAFWLKIKLAFRKQIQKRMSSTTTGIFVVASTLLLVIINTTIGCPQSACTINGGWCPTSTGYHSGDLTIVNSQGNVCLPGGTIPKKYVNYYI